MSQKISHATIDRINRSQDRLIAARLRRDRRVLRTARQNLRRWMARDGRNVRPVFQEWQTILERLTAREVADFLSSDTPMARRLRQSSPFAGVLTDLERRGIHRMHEKKGA